MSETMQTEASGWVARVRVSGQWIRVTITEISGEEVLRARFGRRPAHRRALLDLLESVAMWRGAPLSAVLSVVGWVRPLCDSASWADELVLGPSALVRVHYAVHGSRQLRLGEAPDELAAARARRQGAAQAQAQLEGGLDDDF